MNTAWLLVPALRELGREREARIVASLAAATARGGYREHYDPLTGDGLGARGLGWSTLLVDLLGVEVDDPTKGHRMSDGSADKTKGRVKEAAGELTDDDSLKNEGKVDKASGSVKDTVGDVADKAKGLLRKD